MAGFGHWFGTQACTLDKPPHPGGSFTPPPQQTETHFEMFETGRVIDEVLLEFKQ